MYVEALAGTSHARSSQLRVCGNCANSERKGNDEALKSRNMSDTHRISRRLFLIDSSHYFSLSLGNAKDFGLPESRFTRSKLTGHVKSVATKDAHS